MALDYSADQLIQYVRDITYAGTSTRDWDDPRVLRRLNVDVDAYLLPFIVKARKNHFVTFVDVPLVSGQNNYYAPSKALGGKLRALHLVDASGNPFARLNEEALESVVNYGIGAFGGSLPTGTPQVYYWRGNQIILYPTPATTLNGVSLRFEYPARPSTLVLKASCVQITNLTGGGGAAAGHFRVGIGATVPSGYTSAVSCDLVQNVPGFDVLFTGAISSITAGTFVDFAGTLPTQLAVGDWLCLADTAPVITGAVAEIVVDCLIQKVALQIMAGKDKANYALRKDLLKEAEKEAELFLRRRNEGDHAKVGGGMLSRFRRAYSAP